MSPARLHRTIRLAGLTLASLVLAACSSGPRTPVDADQRLLIDATAAHLATSDRLGPGTLYVLDHFDAAVVDRMRDVKGFGDSLAGDPPLSGGLSLETQNAVQNRFGTGRSVEFVSSADEVPRTGQEILGCTPFGTGVTYVEFAPVRAMAVHGDVHFVAIGLSTGCDWRPLAIRLGWRPGTLFGGTWEVLNVVEGPAVAV